MKELYEQLGISSKVYDFGAEIEASLKERFEQFDKTAEYNQLKVLMAMQKNKVSAECFQSSSGYGYDDFGRDTLEKVYADTFHTEACLIRSQITCGTHALAIPFTPFGAALGLVALPASYFAYLIPCILLYMMLATSLKKAYVRYYGELL